MKGRFHIWLKNIFLLLFIYGVTVQMFQPESISAPVPGNNDNQDQRIKIGVILPLSKEDSISGIPNFLGIITAFLSSKLVKEDHCKFELIVCDDEGDKDKAVKAAEKLLKDGALAILGSVSSEVTKAILDKTRGKVVLISGQATKTGLKDPWFFRVDVPNDRLAEYVVDYLSQKSQNDALINKKISLLYNEDNLFSQDLQSELDKACENSKNSIRPIPYKPNFKTGDIKNAINKIRPDTEVLIIVNGSDQEAACVLSEIKKQKGNNLKNYEDHIFTIEVHPALYETKLFDNVYMVTTYYPLADNRKPLANQRISIIKFEDNYKKIYDKAINLYYEYGKCNLIDEKNTENAVVLRCEPQKNVSLSKIFKESLTGFKVNNKYLTNKIPSYATILGYDQANILLAAISNCMMDNKSKNLIFTPGKDQEKRDNIQSRLGELVYPGALGMYIFNRDNHDGIAQPEVKIPQPQPWLDSFVPEYEFLRFTKASFNVSFDRKGGNINTVGLSLSPKLAFSINLPGSWELVQWEPGFFFKYSLVKQDAVRTSTSIYGLNTLSFSYKGIKDYIVPYLAIFGLGWTYIKTTNQAKVRDFSFIHTLGFNIPLSVVTKMLCLNIEGSVYNKYNTPVAFNHESLMKTLNIGLTFIFPPPR